MMMTLPVVVMVFGISVVGLQAGLIQYRLQATASDDARLASLGMPVENVRYDEDLVCVTRTQSLSGGVWALRPVSLGARACALNPEKDGMVSYAYHPGPHVVPALHGWRCFCNAEKKYTGRYQPVCDRPGSTGIGII